MRLGMNTNALFAPTQRMLRALKETMAEGLSRIEISYYAESQDAEDELLVFEFPERAHNDLNDVLEALNSVSGLCYRVSLLNLLQTFQGQAKRR